MADSKNPFETSAQGQDTPPLEEQERNQRGSNLEKDPDQWTTGGEPMTDAQRSYLKTLSDQAGEEMPEHLTKADASKRIDELQQKTGRGTSTRSS